MTIIGIVKKTAETIGISTIARILADLQRFWICRLYRISMQCSEWIYIKVWQNNAFILYSMYNPCIHTPCIEKRSDRREIKKDSLHCVRIDGRGQGQCPICRGLSVEYWGVGYLTRTNPKQKPLKIFLKI